MAATLLALLLGPLALLDRVLHSTGPAGQRDAREEIGLDDPSLTSGTGGTARSDNRRVLATHARVADEVVREHNLALRHERASEAGVTTAQVGDDGAAGERGEEGDNVRERRRGPAGRELAVRVVVLLLSACDPLIGAHVGKDLGVLLHHGHGVGRGSRVQLLVDPAEAGALELGAHLALHVGQSGV